MLVFTTLQKITVHFKSFILQNFVILVLVCTQKNSQNENKIMNKQKIDNSK